MPPARDLHCPPVCVRPVGRVAGAVRVKHADGSRVARNARTALIADLQQPRRQPHLDRDLDLDHEKDDPDMLTAIVEHRDGEKIFNPKFTEIKT